jgi:jouberin
MNYYYRAFGMVTSKFPIHCRLSPDGQYILSGSEDGKPHLWEVTSGHLFDIPNCDYNINGPVADVAWCENYNMIAMCGFGDEYPIVLYCYETESDLTLETYKKLIGGLR